MEQYNLFNPLRCPVLEVVRLGVFCPDFLLTDSTFLYAKLTYNGIFNKKGYIETQQNKWEIKPRKSFCRSFVVTDSGSNKIEAIVKTSLWSEKASVEFTSGPVFALKREGLFSKVRSFYNSSPGKTLSIACGFWSYKKPFRIQFEPNGENSDVNLLLLVCIGLNLILINREYMATGA